LKLKQAAAKSREVALTLENGGSKIDDREWRMENEKI
jgi:hypothetical protein